ncbi:MAG TPA: hypothetical protein VGT24_13595 [Candidatus Acidoferrales bacterium]|nr:hypothetical protein [Candidatus Acidoferrales bacterium]
MATPNPTNDTTRATIFQLALTVNDSIIRHVADASARLQRKDEEGVLDTTYELQDAVNLIRSLMQWAQDLNPEKEKTA